MQNPKVMPFFIPLSMMIATSMDSAPASLEYGPQTSMGNGTVRSWVQKGSDGNPEKIGLTLTAGALEGLPFSEYNNISKTFGIALPKAIKGRPFDHVSIDYATLGHEPLEIYGSAHFDIHFYICSIEEQMTMKIGGPQDLKIFDRPVPPGYMAPDYVMVPGTEIPNMGVHWVDLASSEFHGHEFKCSMIYGSYSGKLQFIEPMVTQAFLENHPDFTAPMKRPKFALTPGFYPGEFGVFYDESENAYKIWLGKFTYLKAPK